MIFRLVLITLFVTGSMTAKASDDWFETLKRSGDDRALYQVLHAMPKGGDLHNHNSGSIYPEWWLEAALAQRERGYRYYSKVRINNCRPFDQVTDSYLLMFRNIDGAEYDSLDDCERSEYRALESLTDAEREGWLNSLKLNSPAEGREEFFSKHWQRLNALQFNPYIRADNLYRNMRALADEGAIYLEAQVGVFRARDADGNELTAQQMIDILRARLSEDDAGATGMTVRLQLTLLRFLPDAEQTLRTLYGLAVDNRDLIAGVNFVGREDNDKGYPRRFLSTLRELRRQHDLPLAIHAGEVDEPNAHVRDTLLLGADRIGHGLNLILDDDTMLLMRNGPYLVEINLISNLLLNYVVDYSQHPFPEYLRIGIPVALSTDDRGMWDSSLTDEFFVAVKAFNLSWQEVKLLSRNSLQYGFAEKAVRERLTERFDQRIQRFERRMAKGGLAKSERFPDTRSFICARYTLCE